MMIVNILQTKTSVKEFYDMYGERLSTGGATPYACYSSEQRYVKTFFGFKPLEIEIGISNVEIADRVLVKKTLKSSRVKLNRGDQFVFRLMPAGGSEIIPGWGIVLSNLYARPWGDEELEMLMSTSITGILWELPDDEGLIYYEAADAS